MNLEKIIHNNNFKDKHILFLIINKILGLSKEQVYLNFNKEISKEDFNKIESIYNKYEKENIPIEYLLEEVEFMNEIFYVNENVLIPRPETEYLIKYVLEENIENFETMYDIGTGSGIIAIMLAKLTGKEIIGSDISEKVLQVAKKNAKNILNNKNISFTKSDLGEHIKNNNFILCANLPYLEENFKLDELAKKEPKTALYAGKDGLDLYRKLLNQLENKNYIAFFELTEKQAHILNKEYNLNGDILETCHKNIKILKFKK